MTSCDCPAWLVITNQWRCAKNYQSYAKPSYDVMVMSSEFLFPIGPMAIKDAAHFLGCSRENIYHAVKKNTIIGGQYTVERIDAVWKSLNYKTATV